MFVHVFSTLILNCFCVPQASTPVAGGACGFGGAGGVGSAGGAGSVQLDMVRHGPAWISSMFWENFCAYCY